MPNKNETINQRNEMRDNQQYTENSCVITKWRYTNNRKLIPNELQMTQMKYMTKEDQM